MWRENISSRYIVNVLFALFSQEGANSHEFGMISLRVYYNTEAEILSVEGKSVTLTL